GAVLDQRDVAVADVLVDHRIAFYTQRVNTIRLHPSQQETRHRYSFFIIDDLERRTRGNPAEQLNFAQRVATLVFDFDVQCERAVFVFTDQQTTTLERRDMLRNRRARLHSKLPRDLCVRGDVTVAFLKTCDVIENFFLSLRSWEHLNLQFPITLPACSSLRVRVCR